jgi:hypothetical protein
MILEVFRGTNCASSVPETVECLVSDFAERVDAGCLLPITVAAPVN